MKWHEFVKDYFTFSRKERIGTLIIALAILFISFAPKIISFHKINPKHSKQDSLWILSMKKLEKKPEKEPGQNGTSNNTDEQDYTYQYDSPEKNYEDEKKELFYFDPNTLSVKGWERLGLKEASIQMIRDYLNNGGHFNEPQDLQKIKGFPQDEYERLAPYIQIISHFAIKDTPEKILRQQESSISSEKNETSSSKNNPYTSSIVDINIADSSALEALPGIGNKLAARIIKFRERLGGFYSIDQIGETYGLTDSTFGKIKPYLKVENNSIRKININTATVDQLKIHPYIKWNIANAIVEYRNEHGNFLQIQDLRKISAITEDIYIKIAPYLIIQ